MTTDSNHNIWLPRWGPRALWAAPFAALMILMTLAVACSGGSSSPGVANVDSTPNPSNGASSTPGTSSNGPSEDDMLAYSQCMRDNGVPNFPDPNPDGSLSLDAGALGIEPNSPQFRAADEACKEYSPSQAQPPALDPERRDAVVKYAQCMRDEGITNFPDPKPNGTLEIDANALGLGPDSPQFEAADQACKHHLPGGGDGGSTNQSGGN